jgi:hypothetical protein
MNLRIEKIFHCLIFIISIIVSSGCAQSVIGNKAQQDDIKSAYGKNSEPVNVKPCYWKNTEFQAIQNGRLVEARDIKSGKKIWESYVREEDDTNSKADEKEPVIIELFIFDDRLFVTNETQKVYILDKTTGKLLESYDDLDKYEWEKCRKDFGDNFIKKNKNIRLAYQIFFPTVELGKEAENDFRSAGFDFMFIGTGHDPDHPSDWRCDALEPVKFTLKEIKADKQKVTDVAERHGGTYKYWNIIW